MSSYYGLDVESDYFSHHQRGRDCSYMASSHQRCVSDNCLVSSQSSQDFGKKIKEEAKNENCSVTKEMKQPTQKQSQVKATLKWLNENYEESDDVCLQRCVVYTHYLDFCKIHDLNPSGPATFGKIIRQKFPKVTTRRLGTRGQSKYHYYGIGIRESSVFYQSVYTGQGLTRFSGTKVKIEEGSHKKYSLSSHTGTLLPDFPDISNFILPPTVDKDKIGTFFIMYRTHCQRIVDTSISSHFEEIEGLLLHFWQGMPDHLHEILDHTITSDVISLCDSVMYKVLVDVLIPTSIQDTPERLKNEIEAFTTQLPNWIKLSVEETPSHVHDRKLNACKRFTRIVNRHFSFIHLAQTARSVLLNTDNINTMMKDLCEINLTDITFQFQFLHGRDDHRRLIISQSFETFKVLLQEQTTVERLIEWLDDLIDKNIFKRSKNTQCGFQDDLAADFLLHWSLIGSFIMRDLTLHSASSFVITINVVNSMITARENVDIVEEVTTFYSEENQETGSLHLLHMMLDEYIFLVVETQQYKKHNEELQLNLQKYMIQPDLPVDNGNNKKQVHKCESDTLKAAKTRGNVAFIKPFPVVRHERVIDHSEFSPTDYCANPSRSCDPPFPPVKSLPNVNGHFIGDHHDGNSNSSYPEININSAFPVPRFPVVTYQQPHPHLQCFPPCTNRQLTSVDRYSWMDNRSLPVGNVPIHHVTYGCQGLENYTRSNFYQDSVNHPVALSSLNSPQVEYPYHQHQQQFQSLPYNPTVSHPYQFIEGNT